jgi:hypothetical protein
VLGLVCPLHAYAINPPHWDQFSKGEFVDIANVKADGNVVAAYVKRADAQKEVTTLYEVDCQGDKIRVHSDIQRYRSVPVQGGTRVVVPDDRFKSVVPGSRNARIENAICEVAARQEAERERQRKQAECERARHDDPLRIVLVKERLSQDETLCLLAVARGERTVECNKARVPTNVSVDQYLHDKGIFLECEDSSKY